MLVPSKHYGNRISSVILSERIMFPNRVIITPVFFVRSSAVTYLLCTGNWRWSKLEHWVTPTWSSVIKIQIVKFAPHADSHDRTNAYYLVTGWCSSERENQRDDVFRHTYTRLTWPWRNNALFQDFTFKGTMRHNTLIRSTVGTSFLWLFCLKKVLFCPSSDSAVGKSIINRFDILHHASNV